MKKIIDVIDARDNAFDMFRLFAAFLVLFAHAYHIFGVGADPVTPYIGIYTGTIAVFVFFCISGFFISKSAVERDSKVFFVSRCTRIFPALFVCNAVTLFLILPWMKDDWYKITMSMDGVSYIYKNTTLLFGLQFSLPDLFGGHPDKAINGSLWTLPFELQAYMLAFFFGAFGWLANRLRFNLIFIMVIYVYGAHPDFIFSLIPLESAHALFMTFFIGAAIYVNRSWLPLSLGVVLLSCIFLGLFFYYLNLKLISLALFCYICISIGYLLNNSRLKLKNDYSYGVYLYAYPLSQLSYYFFKNSFILYFCFIVVGTFILSYASWHLIEKPAMRISKKWLVGEE